MTLNHTGHSILHELTHLDSLAEQAGLSPDDDGAHGTLDVQDKPQLSGARDYLKKYVKNSKLASPDYNAESYAATATGKSPLSSQILQYTRFAHLCVS